MPNWCWCSLVATGDKTEVRDLYDKIKSLEERETSLVENGFGKLWLGNLVTLLGGDWNKFYYRGEIEYFEIDCDDGAVRFNVMSAWSEPYEVIQLLHFKYPNLEFYFLAEEPGMGHFVTNDKSGEQFPERYYFSEPDDCEPFYYEEEELEDFLRDVGKFLGKEVKTAEEARDAIHAYNGTIDNGGGYAEVRIIQVITPNIFPMDKNLSTHQRGVILRGICGGAALKDKEPQISEGNTVITTTKELDVWDMCCISSDAEAFNMKASFGYDGQTIITFTPKE